MSEYCWGRAEASSLREGSEIHPLSPMVSPSSFSRAGFWLLAALLLPLAACDSALTETGGETPPASLSKVRHADLFDRAARTTGPTRTLSGDGDARLAGNDGGTEYVSVIVSLDPYRLVERYGEVDPYRLVERYRLVDRYRLVERYEYSEVFDGFAVWVAEDDLDALLEAMQQDAEVLWIEPDVQMAVDPLGVTAVNGGESETMPWSVATVGAGTGSAAGVDLYVADTGIHSDDLNEVSSQDFSEGRDSRDIDGHGTHVAGVAAARVDGKGIRGIAPGVDVHDIRVLTGKEKAKGRRVDLSGAIAAVEYVTGQKQANPTRPAVLNFSLGTDIGTPTYNALDDAVEAAAAAGVVVVVAAGNAGVDVSTVSPAHAKSAITVGAYGPDKAFAPFSNRGTGIDILAPGVDILSLASADLDGELAIMSGTSMAAGHVSGAAALFLATNPNATAQQVADALVSKARPDVTGAPGQTTNRSLWLGAGGALDVEIPPLFDYAVLSGQTLTFADDDTYISTSLTTPTENANVLAGALDVAKSATTLRSFGFGYYMESLTLEVPNAFRPRSNPAKLDAVRQVDPVHIDRTKIKEVRAFAPLATRTTDGDLTLDGTVQLGTEEAPTVWYVKGDLRVAADARARLYGYGVFLVEGDVVVEGEWISSVSKRDAELAIFTDQNVDMTGGRVLLPGTVFAWGDVTLGTTATDQASYIYGNVLALGNVTFTETDSRVILRQEPLHPALARALWPN